VNVTPSPRDLAPDAKDAGEPKPMDGGSLGDGAKPAWANAAALLPLRPSGVRRVLDMLMGKFVTLVLASGALALGVATFVLLARGVPRDNQVFVAVLANSVVLLLLGAVMAGRLTRVWVERRRGSAGSHLHIRLVLMFSVVAVIPAIVVAVFSTVFFNLGIQTWFAEPVRTTLEESLQAAQGYLDEHRNNIRADALTMAGDLERGIMLSGDLQLFREMLNQQTTLRGLTEAVIYDRGAAAAGLGDRAGVAWRCRRARRERRDPGPRRCPASPDGAPDHVPADRPAGGSGHPRSCGADRAGGRRL
jgi:NtrY N-terminal region